MSKICRENHSGINNIERNYMVAEFHEAVDNIGCESSMYVMLGNTLANYLDMDKILNLMNNTRSYILLGIELIAGNIEEILAEYRTPENYALTFRPLGYIGVQRSAGDINIIFNNELSRIEEWFIFSEECMIGDYLIPRDSRILLSITQKPSLGQMQKIIIDSGLQIIRQETEQNQALMLII